MKKVTDLPKDLQIALCFIIITILFVLVPVLGSSIIRAFLGIIFVLFLPGYLLISALFPAKTDLDGIERIALSFGLSIAVVPLLGLILNYTPWGIRLIPILGTLSIFCIVMLVIAYYRRMKLVEAQRFCVPFNDYILTIKQEIFKPSTRQDKILTIILVISIILAVSMIIYVIITPKIGEQFTEFYILDINGKAEDYPVDMVVGIPAELIVGIVNHEYALKNYTMQVELDKDILTSQEIQLAHNETWENKIALTPGKAGTDMKMEFLLFKENNITKPYRSLHLWVNTTQQ